MKQVRSPLAKGTTLTGCHCYTIKKQLGGGGFGLIYLATQHGDKVSRVVIKEHFPRWYATRTPGHKEITVMENLHSEYEWSLSVFKREAQQLSKLGHKSIVQNVDSFDQNNTAYYVMPYIGGGTLVDAIELLCSENRRLSQATLSQMMKMLLSALDHMHHTLLGGKPVYHLDIKPGNILFADDGCMSRPVLIDSGSPHMGSADFIPHEQRQENEIGPWTDLYALAATFYMVLTGKAPASHFDSKRNVLDTPPQNIPLAGMRNLQANYDVTFLQSIDKALSWRPQDRYGSADEWLEALDNIPLRWSDSGMGLHELIRAIHDYKNPPWYRQKAVIIFLCLLALVFFGSLIAIFVVPTGQEDSALNPFQDLSSCTIFDNEEHGGTTFNQVEENAPRDVEPVPAQPEDKDGKHQKRPSGRDSTKEVFDSIINQKASRPNGFSDADHLGKNTAQAMNKAEEKKAANSTVPPHNCAGRSGNRTDIDRAIYGNGLGCPKCRKIYAEYKKAGIIK